MSQKESKPLQISLSDFYHRENLDLPKINFNCQHFVIITQFFQDLILCL